MPRPSANRRTDLLLATFRAELKRLGFVFHPLDSTFSDLRHRGASIPAVTAGRGLDRKGTLAALLAARKARQDATAAAEAIQIERERTASLIAPQALPAARAGLEGAEAIAQLADDFIIIATRSDGAALPDLVRMGWRKSQLAEHADAARSLAYSRQNGAAV